MSHPLNSILRFVRKVRQNTRKENFEFEAREERFKQDADGFPGPSEAAESVRQASPSPAGN